MSVGRKLRVLPAAAVLALAVSGAFAAPAAALTGAPPAECVPNPGRSLVVATVPPVEGFTFQVGERRYRTDRSGTVRIAPVTCPEEDEAIAPITETIDQGGGTTATFDAWHGAEQLAREDGDGTLYAAFQQQVQVNLDLVDLAGRPVARDAVGSIVLKSSTGAEVEVPPGESSMTLHASRVVQFANGLFSKDILWSVQSADVEGNTAVNRGQIRFEPRRTRTITVPLMLFELRVAVRDVILRRPVGEQVLVSSPDGSDRKIRLDSGASGEIAALARGHYTLKASGASIAMGFEQPVAISRPQEADLSVISYLDLAIVGGTFLSVVIGLFVVGWRLHVRTGREKDPSAGARPGSPDAVAAGSGSDPIHRQATT